MPQLQMEESKHEFELPAAQSRMARPSRKQLTRRAPVDYSQQLRRAFQFGFLLLNIVLGLKFYLWVRSFESVRPVAKVTRPAGIEGWLPIAGLMNLKYWITTGQI